MNDPLTSSLQQLPLQDRHALVTGGTRGIGFAIARALLQQGARVTVAARNPLHLEQARTGLGALGQVHCLELDVTDSRAIGAAFNAAVDHFGPISILVNNAGQAQTAPFMKTDMHMLEQMLAVNLSSVLLCSQAVLPGMLENGWGRIVNIASTAALTGYGYASAYCASKHAVLGLTRAVALEVASKGVTVNAVCPGFTETDLTLDAIANIVKKTGRSSAQARSDLAANNPEGRLIQPDEVAGTVTRLCLPAASAINGQAVPVDGGELIGGR